MTKKDYVKLADLFKRMYPATHNGQPALDAFAEWGDLKEGLMEILAADNPRFDRDRFNAACKG